MASIKRLLSPWGIALVLLFIFLVWQGHGYWRDRGLEQALADNAAFASPQLKLDFPKNIKYDSLSFVGRGAHVGLWSWTPQGLVLTPEGEKYFRMEGDQITSQVPAGTRQVKRIQSQGARGGGTQLDFFYEWTEISPATQALLLPAPKKGEEYLGRALLEHNGDGWQVRSLETRDFDEALGRVQDVAHGMLR